MKRPILSGRPDPDRTLCLWRILGRSAIQTVLPTKQDSLQAKGGAEGLGDFMDNPGQGVLV